MSDHLQQERDMLYQALVDIHQRLQLNLPSASKVIHALALCNSAMKRITEEHTKKNGAAYID